MEVRPNDLWLLSFCMHLFSFGKVTNPQLLLPSLSDSPRPLCPKLSPGWQIPPSIIA